MSDKFALFFAPTLVFFVSFGFVVMTAMAHAPSFAEKMGVVGRFGSPLFNLAFVISTVLAFVFLFAILEEGDFSAS